jgi:hypothetical protein
MWLNFDKQEKGYREFLLTKENVKANRGKQIVYLRKFDIDENRGYAYPRYAKLHDMKYSQVLLDEGFDSIDKRDVVECGIKIEGSD